MPAEAQGLPKLLQERNPRAAHLPGWAHVPMAQSHPEHGAPNRKTGTFLLLTRRTGRHLTMPEARWALTTRQLGGRAAPALGQKTQGHQLREQAGYLPAVSQGRTFLVPLLRGRLRAGRAGGEGAASSCPRAPARGRQSSAPPACNTATALAGSWGPSVRTLAGAGVSWPRFYLHPAWQRGGVRDLLPAFAQP